MLIDPPDTATSFAVKPVVDSLVVNVNAMLASLLVAPLLTVDEVIVIVRAVES